MKMYKCYSALLLVIVCFGFAELEKTNNCFSGIWTNKSACSFISEIRELNNSNVYMRDNDRVNSILKIIIQGGTNTLQIVSDFDRTITRQREEGSTAISKFSSFSLFNHCPSVTKKYSTTMQNLYNKYFPYEIDASLPQEEKRKLMVQWWSQSENALKGLKISQEEIQETATKCKIYLRDGTEQLFDDLNKAEVPVLVFSAGLGDTVAAVLQKFNILFSNVKVISNFLKYDEYGVIQGFNSSAIHIYNKNEFALNETDYYGLIKNRENVVLMGDSLGDSGMADGVHHAKAVLKIGFLYGNASNNLTAFMNKFDIVLEDDQTMAVLKAILKNIQEKQRILI